MAISPLPQATIHLLGSSQTLTTSLSLVKELIDNALDAKATSVDVLISQNTLDKVEIRDNGHGIVPEDYEALGRRGHTSKLRSFDELKSVGGVTLGFRGEALASAVQLGEVTVTTKTEGEQVGSCLVLKAPGGILKQSRISHPVGTTVCVKNFISRIPVRQQVALKAAPKMLVKIKELLQSYALARPTIRFSLKIMKESKGSWSFVPRPSEGIRGAATQVIGKDAVMECVEKSLAFAEHKPASSLMKDPDDAFEGGDGSNSLVKENGFVVEMFLPKPDANLAKIGHGQYISVDSRPIANDKGTMKKIVTLLKAYVKGSHCDTIDTIKNPFFRMNIICPVASYDPNVEPAKDDVLFVNEDWVIESIESLFKEFYGEQEKSTVSRSSKASTKPVDDFSLLLARDRPTLTQNGPEVEGTLAFPKKPSNTPTVVGNRTPLETRQTIDLTDQDESSESAEEEDILQAKETPHRRGIDMSIDLSEEVEDLHAHSSAQSQEGGSSNHQQMQAAGSRLNSMNPWVIAKLTTPVRPRVEIVSTPPEVHDSSQHYATQSLPTPYCSSISAMPDVRTRPTVARASRQREVSNPYQLTPLASREIPEFQVESPVAHRRAPVCHVHTVPLENSQESSPLLVGDDASEFARRNDFISARNVTEEHIARPTIPESVKLPKSKIGKANLNKSSPHVNMQTSSRDNLRQVTLYKPPLTMGQSTQQEEDPELEWSMDYENRKEEFTRQQRLRAKAARTKVAVEEVEADVDVDADVVRSSPHKNRYHAALATLSQGEVQPQAQNNIIKRPFKTMIPDGDPRAYLMRRQRSMSVQPGVTSKMTRLRSNRLPLERIPENEEMHSLMLTIPTNIDTIREMAQTFGQDDTYIRNGTLGHGLIMSVAETPDFIWRIKDVATKWKETKIDGDLETEYSFGNLAQARIEMLR